MINGWLIEVLRLKTPVGQLFFSVNRRLSPVNSIKARYLSKDAIE
jgi:hypothetical protein